MTAMERTHGLRARCIRALHMLDPSLSQRVQLKGTQCATDLLNPLALGFFAKMTKERERYRLIECVLERGRECMRERRRERER